MRKIFRVILGYFRGKHGQKVYQIDRLPICLELSDGDHAALYGWPDRYVNDDN